VSLPIGTWRSAIRKVVDREDDAHLGGADRDQRGKDRDEDHHAPAAESADELKTMTPRMTGSLKTSRIGAGSSTGFLNEPGFASGREIATRIVANAERPAMT